MIRTFTKRVEDNSPIALFFNKCLEGCNTAMIFSAPRTFALSREEHNNNDIYCTVLLFEEYAASIIVKLQKIVSVISEYQKDFDGHWKYYASSKRIDAIKEYGGEDYDYNDDGSIVTIGVPEDRLEAYSVINDLYDFDTVDIVQDTTIQDIQSVATMIQTDSRMTITDMFEQTIGKTILPSKIDTEGDLRQMSRMDVEMDKALKSADGDMLAHTLCLVCHMMQYILTYIKQLPKRKDNKEELLYIRDFAQNLLNADFEAVLKDKKFLKSCIISGKEEVV